MNHIQGLVYLIQNKPTQNIFDQISAIQQIIGSNAQVQVISGYRSPKTNKMLRAKSSAVAKKSHHMLGKAIDFRLEGVPLADVREAALSLKAGGVGYYPNSPTSPCRAGHTGPSKGNGQSH